jgi:adenosylhomocysteine nucleosidase
LRGRDATWLVGAVALALAVAGIALRWHRAAPQPRISAMNPVVRRVAVIAAMPSELQPFVRKVDGTMTRELLGDRPLYRGRIGDAEVLATRTGMGTELATRVTDQLLDAFPIDHVIAIGIAGGVRGMQIGDVLTPSVVINADDGTEHLPTPPPGVTPRGRLRTSTQFSVDPGLMQRLASEGIDAVDMETAAIGASAERHGCTWSVYRAISDRAGDGLIGMDTFGLAHPDGSPDVWAGLRFIARRPWMLPRLLRLGRDAHQAAEAAADAALRELQGG